MTWVSDLLPPVPGPAVPSLVDSPCRAAAYLEGVREVTLESGRARPLLRLGDKHMNVVADLHGEISASAEELMSDSGVAKVVISYNNWLMDYVTNETMPIEDLHLLIDLVPTKPNWRTRWGGKLTEINVKRQEDGKRVIELTAVSFREHAKRLLIAANPVFPPEIQLPRMWVLPGPVRSICAATMAVNLGRNYMPGWSTITNLFNPMAWINPMNMGGFANVSPLHWPVQVAFVNPVLDQSRWSSIGSSWQDAHSVFKDLLTDAGVQMRAYTYLTSDEDSPNQELEKLLLGMPELLERLFGKDWSKEKDFLRKLVAPKRNCVMFAFEDMSGHSGPTGTVVDGIIDTVAVTLDNLITPVVVDLNTGDTFDPGNTLNGMPIYEATGIGRTHLLEQLALTAPPPPKVIWWEGEYSGVNTSSLIWHKGSAATIMTGSKSPSIVNSAQTFAIKYGLARLSDAINVWVAGPTGQVQVPMSNGLDNLYNNQLDNTLLAWQRFTDPMRALKAGDMKWLEHFEAGTGTAYTLASILTLREGYWKTRPWCAFKAGTLNGMPWLAYIDYQLGQRVGFEHDGILYVDNVTSIKWSWSDNNAMRVDLKIGDDNNRDDPFAAAFKTMANVYKLVGQLAGEGTLFG